MPPRTAQSAARRRCEEQLARLDALPLDAKVNAIRPMGDDQSRLTVRVGRARFGPVHAVDRDGLGLSPGASLDAAARGRLADALAREAARADALRLLGTRSRSRRDLLHRLTQKGHDRGSAGSALDRLERVGLSDDESPARDRATGLADSGRAGPRAAEGKLRAIGIDGPTAAAAVREAYAQTDLLAQATEAAHRRARTFPTALDRPTRQRRLFGFLARRGYDHDTCRRAAQAALGGPDPD